MSAVRFIQTCDPTKYSQLLMVTAPTIIEYCRRFECELDLFVGIKRGRKPWHAALNRIVILKDYIDNGHGGWVIYVDSDAYIADLEFDIKSYLSSMCDCAFIASPSGGEPHVWWNINNGVFAINLGHPVGQDIVRRWHAKLMAIPLKALESENVWGDLIDDQTALFEVFQEIDGCERFVVNECELFNWDNRFIRQIVRGHGSIDYREAKLREAVNSLLGIERKHKENNLTVALNDVNREFIYALYRVIFMREADITGFSTIMDLLARKERTYEQVLRSSFDAEEFRAKVPEFLRRYLPPETLAAVGVYFMENRTDQPGE